MQRNRHIEHRTLRINNQTIEKLGNDKEINYFKFLGVHIDANISWKVHIDKICTNISRANYLIDKAKKFLPKSGLLTLYINH